MTRVPGPAVAFVLAASVVAMTALAGCGERKPAPATRSPSASGSTLPPHPVVRLSADGDAVTVPQILRATEGGPSVERYVRVRNATGRLTRSDLRIAISLAPGEIGGSVRQLHWSINRQGRWSDLTGRTHVETDEFELKPGESRTVRIRLAVPTDDEPDGSDDVGAVLWAAVTAPWWPSDPEQPSGITRNPESTNVLLAR